MSFENEYLNDLIEISSLFPSERPFRTAANDPYLQLLQIFMEEHGVAFSPDETIGELCVRIRSAAGCVTEAKGADSEDPTFNIVFLGHGETFCWVNEAYLQSIEKIVKIPVRFIKLRLPPVGIVLSDLAFIDQRLEFFDEVQREKYASVIHAFRVLRSASMIIVDDVLEVQQLMWEQTYGFLSHDDERDPRADLIGVRWQHYATHHHELPLGVIKSMDLLACGEASINRTLVELGRYLGTPIMRVACLPQLSSFTKDWEITLDNRITMADLSNENHIRVFNLANAIKTLIAGRMDLYQPKTSPVRMNLRQAEMPNYSSQFISMAFIDEILGLFDSFLICGAPASVPYIAKALRALDKPSERICHYGLISNDHRATYSCTLIVGPMGNTPPAQIPYINVMPNRSAVPYGNLPEKVMAKMSERLRAASSLSEHPRFPSKGLYVPA